MQVNAAAEIDNLLLWLNPVRPPTHLAGSRRTYYLTTLPRSVGYAAKRLATGTSLNTPWTFPP